MIDAHDALIGNPEARQPQQVCPICNTSDRMDVCCGEE